ncbi:MAG: VWA domain-containing protein [Epsilonproteobacteria bacterium]|nr:VWA domain-containing protein [Campylobacterota bacterium]
MIFHDIYYLWLLLLLPPLVMLIKVKGDEFGGVFNRAVLQKIQLKNRTISKKTRSIFLLVAITLSIIALARPQINNGEIKVKSSFINVVTAIDMSKSMFANDVYPNRFEFAKQKFFESLKYFKNAKVALIGFSTQTFLISPLTQDFHSLKFLAKNLSLDYLSLKGTDILATLESANNLFGDEKKKILLMFTDGGDQSDFSKEIAYAKSHNISVYIYNIGTTKGGVIKDKNGVLKDKNGDIVVVKRNDKIKELAIQSGGAFMKYSLAKDDIKLLVDTIASKYKAEDEESSTIQDREELFYYPLALAIIFYMMALFSLPRIKEKK